MQWDFTLYFYLQGNYRSTNVLVPFYVVFCVENIFDVASSSNSKQTTVTGFCFHHTVGTMPETLLETGLFSREVPYSGYDMSSKMLDQCFHNCVPRNPRVLWNENKGAARKFHYSLRKKKQNTGADKMRLRLPSIKSNNAKKKWKATFRTEIFKYAAYSLLSLILRAYKICFNF